MVSVWAAAGPGWRTTTAPLGTMTPGHECERTVKQQQWLSHKHDSDVECRESTDNRVHCTRREDFHPVALAAGTNIQGEYDWLQTFYVVGFIRDERNMNYEFEGT